MELSAVQSRTLRELIGLDEGPPAPDGLAERLRARLEGALRSIDLAVPVRLSKSRLNDHGRCEGLFAAGLLGEMPPFAYSVQSAVGDMLHKAIELDVGAREERDPWDLVLCAVARLVEHAGFRAFWTELDSLEQDEVSMEAVRRLVLFRGSFPPLRELRRGLAPISEVWLEGRFADGRVVVSGRVDLMLGRTHPSRATRVLIDLKTGGAWPDHPEDMRLYALLHTLRFGVPPRRVATLFLGSGDWQAEEVDERVLDHAADRIIAATRGAAEAARGSEGALRPGPWCGWCPRAATCPVSSVARD